MSIEHGEGEGILLRKYGRSSRPTSVIARLMPGEFIRIEESNRARFGLDGPAEILRLFDARLGVVLPGNKFRNDFLAVFFHVTGGVSTDQVNVELIDAFVTEFL